MDRNLALEFVRVTEAAAIAAAHFIGKGDGKAADKAAVDEMRARFNQIDFAGTVVIGEGSMDEAPELYAGEKVGTRHSGGQAGKGPEIDLAVDPLECTDSVAHGRYNALSVIAAGPKGSLFASPEAYMEKIAAGPKVRAVIDIDATVKDNVKKAAKALGKDIREVTVLTLDRPRHEQMIKEIRQTGARVRLITDGDVAGAIAPCLPGSGIDLLMGIGKSTEAVLAAVAVKILGGQILCRFKSDSGLDSKKIYAAADLAKGETLTFTATGVIDGPLLNGVILESDKIVTHSVVMRAQSRTVRYITTHHHLKPKIT